MSPLKQTRQKKMQKGRKHKDSSHCWRLEEGRDLWWLRLTLSCQQEMGSSDPQLHGPGFCPEMKGTQKQTHHQSLRELHPATPRFRPCEAQAGNQPSPGSLTYTNCKIISGHCFVAICYSSNWKLLTNS